MGLFIKKPLEALQAEANQSGEYKYPPAAPAPNINITINIIIHKLKPFFFNFICDYWEDEV